MTYVYTVNPIGKSVGLALFWRKGCDVHILEADKNVLDVKLQMENVQFFIVGVENGCDEVNDQIPEE